MLDRLEKVRERYDELTSLLSDPAVLSNQERIRQLSKEHSDLAPLIRVYNMYRKEKQNLAGLKEITETSSDPEMKQLAYGELEEARGKVSRLEEELKSLLIPKDPNDSRDVILEIRAGTGGEEAALFGADLYRMYSRFAEKQGWKVEVLDLNDMGKGGIKEISFALSGEDVFGTMKFESGVHRVQRVPETETQGRVHTSAATVAVLPKWSRLTWRSIRRTWRWTRSVRVGKGDRTSTRSRPPSGSRTVRAGLSSSAARNGHSSRTGSGR